MSVTSRSHVASSFTIVKGALIPESYTVLARWDFSLTKRENLDRLRRDNFIGARSATWLRDVAAVLNRRLDPEGRDRPLTLLAQSGVGMEEWRPLLLWHITRDEFLLRDFLSNWLFRAFEEGLLTVRPEDILAFLRTTSERGGLTEHAWSETTTSRVAGSLLKIATDFGLLSGVQRKRFASVHLPDRSFLYLLHALRETGVALAQLPGVPDWRMFFLRPSDVERELLRLHQYRMLQYHVAGSLVELALPCGSVLEYAQRMVA